LPWDWSGPSGTGRLPLCIERKSEFLKTSRIADMAGMRSDGAVEMLLAFTSPHLFYFEKEG
jgi:hypothetical protein